MKDKHKMFLKSSTWSTANSKKALKCLIKCLFIYLLLIKESSDIDVTAL